MDFNYDSEKSILTIGTETTGLRGYPADRVLEIGIAEYDGDSISGSSSTGNRGTSGTS